MRKYYLSLVVLLTLQVKCFADDQIVKVSSDVGRVTKTVIETKDISYQDTLNEIERHQRQLVEDQKGVDDEEEIIANLQEQLANLEKAGVKPLGAKNIEASTAVIDQAVNP